MSRLLTIEEAALRTGTPVRQIRYWLQTGKIKSMKIGRFHRVAPAEVQRIASGRIGDPRPVWERPLPMALSDSTLENAVRDMTRDPRIEALVESLLTILRSEDLPRRRAIVMAIENAEAVIMMRIEEEWMTEAGIVNRIEEED